MAKMHWRAGRATRWHSPSGHWHGCMENGTIIEVHTDLYDRRLRAYLESIGVRHTTWAEIMEQANREWDDYRRVLDAFAGNLEQWLAVESRDVYIQPPEERE